MTKIKDLTIVELFHPLESRNLFAIDAEGNQWKLVAEEEEGSQYERYYHRAELLRASPEKFAQTLID